MLWRAVPSLPLLVALSLCASSTWLVACTSDAGADGEADADGDAGAPRDSGARPSVRGAGGSARDAADDPSPPAAGDGFLADAGDGWRTLISGEWELPASREGYYCVRRTVPEEVYLHEFKPVIPLGTHHTVLSVSDRPDGPDGVSECGAGVNGQRIIYGSGVGTLPRVLPEGVAVHLRAGEQLLLNLHLFNAAERPLRGTSGTLVKTMDGDDVEDDAEGVLAGPIELTIPPGRVTQAGTCTFQHAATIIVVSPHMHQLGVHMRAVAHSSVDGDVVLYDGPYAFDEQLQYELDGVAMDAGDTVSVECTYENDTDATVRWGDSSLDEMCFAALVRYPSQDASFLCTN